MGTCSAPPYGVGRFISQHAEGARATRSSTSPVGNASTTMPAPYFYFALQMSHGVCLSWPAIHALLVLEEQVWFRTFGAISDSPSVSAFVLSPSFPPFLPAHCELQRTTGLSGILEVQENGGLSGMFINCLRWYKHIINMAHWLHTKLDKCLGA